MAKTKIAPIKNIRNDLTSEYVHSILDYNPETGEFRWKHRSDVRPQVNGRFAGMIAGSIKTSGGIYHCIGIKNTVYLSHRLAWLYMTGKWPKNSLDHKDGNGANNKWNNIRECTHQQNCFNRKRPINSTSGYKGVCYNKENGKWRATIKFGQKKRHIGYFLTAELAYLAYCKTAKELHKEFARII